MAMTSIFPYLPEMIESFGVNRQDVGMYAGLVFAAFNLAQASTGIICGNLSDRYGRKPIILTCLAFCIICNLLWGLASSIPMAVLARLLLGAFNGDVGVIRTMVAEIVPQKHLQPVAFMVMPMVWTAGSIFGPAAGGFLAKPAETMPSLFGKNALFLKYQFLLPNIMACSLYTFGFLAAFLFIEETHEDKRHKKDHGVEIGKRIIAFVKAPFQRRNKAYDYLPVNSIDESESSMLKYTPGPSRISASSSASTTLEPKSFAVHSQVRSTFREVLSLQSLLVLTAYTTTASTVVSYEQLLPVFMHHPQEKHDSMNTQLPFKFSGGFGIDADRIGAILLSMGFAMLVVQLTIFPPLSRRYGVLKLMRFCSLTWPVIIFVTPYLALISNPHLQQLAVILLMAIKSIPVVFMFPALFTLLTNSATSWRTLGTLNGIGVLGSAGGRAVGPVVAGWLYTHGLKVGYSVLPWFALGTFSIIGLLPVWWIVEKEAAQTDGIGGDDIEIQCTDINIALQPSRDEEAGSAIGEGMFVLEADDDDLATGTDGAELHAEARYRPVTNAG